MNCPLFYAVVLTGEGRYVMITSEIRIAEGNHK